MECRSCGAQLPPDAQVCPECGASASRLQQLPRHRRKALHGIIAAAAAIVVIAGVLFWYFITTDRDTNNEVKEAINDMRFSDAEVRMNSVHIFQPSDLELRKSLIAAGHESEERQNVALLQRIAAIREQYDASELAPFRGVIDQLEAKAEPDLYVSLCSEYESGKYADVIEGFKTLAERGYERSRDYLFLAHAHISGNLEDLAEATEMTEPEAEQRLMRMAANGALTADFTLKHLFLLSKADANGKISEGNPKSEASVLLAGELAQEISCYEKPFTFASPYAEYAYLSGKTTDPHNHLYNNTQTTAVMLCGLPGTGKDTYCQQCFPDWPMVSLDAIREETGIPPVGSQKEVVQIARSRAKAFLRQRQSFVWNATSITPDIRSHFVKLCEDYHAYVRIVFLETAYDENLKRNQNRRKAVPPSVIDKMLSKLVLPERFEAHEIMWHCV